MKISATSSEAYDFYLDLNTRCMASRTSRRLQYLQWRQFYLEGHGGDYVTRPPVNKIYPHIDQLTALIYSGETTRFSIDLSPSASDLFKGQATQMQRGINEDWHLSNTDLVFGQALSWSFCYASMLVKMVMNNGQIEPCVVEPHDFGVLREDIGDLHRQEAFSHSYYVTRSQLEYNLSAHPQKEKILAAITPAPKPISNESNQVIDQVITSASNPLMVGNVDINLANSAKYRPQVDADMVEMFELYVFDDEIKDFRVVTLADPGVVIFDRPIDGMFIKKEQPFIKVCPNPQHDYFWGHSEVEKLIPLQKKRNERMAQIEHMMELQARPPKFGSGLTASPDEVANALDTPAGTIFSDMPNAKMDAISPKIPEDLYKEIREIDFQFEDMSGITNVISGKGESGVRSAGHAASLARLGASRAKKRALVIEDQLEKVAEIFIRLKMAYDPRRLKTEDGLLFVPAQFTKEFSVKVDGHSSSPIFMEDTKELAFMLLKAGVIDGESLIDLIDVPMKQLLKDRYKLIQKGKAAALQEERQFELQEAKIGKRPEIKAVS